MIDLNKLSYRAYGNLVLAVLILLAVLLNSFPFSWIGFVTCVVQIPLYLFTRSHLNEPIHANGLNICFVLTVLFYILLFISIKSLAHLINPIFALVFSSISNVLSCYATSTVPNIVEKKGKIFFGYKKANETKYQKLVDYIKFNGINPRLLEVEERLKNFDMQIYLIYKRKFRESKTFREISEEFEIDNPRIVEMLDKGYFYMIGALGI